MDDTPDPAHGRADEALLEVAPDKLEDQAAPVNQVARELHSGESGGHG